MKNGYISKDSATLSDDDMIIQWYSGKLATAGFFPGWTKDYYKSAIDQGIITKEPNYTFVPFPRAPGVKKVPTYANIAAIVVHKTGTTIDKAAAKFAECLNSPQIQALFTRAIDVAPNRIDGILEPANFHVSEVAKIVKENGYMDVGNSDPRFPERRATQFPILQKLLNFKISPEDAILEYQNAMTAVKK
jgi:ABC-type glycerol-3-phosphate transport system substrate-binding protein